MKIVITNRNWGKSIIIFFLCLPFFSAFLPGHHIIYNLKKYENYARPIPFEGTSAAEDLIIGKARTQFLESLGISTFELWMSRIRGIILAISLIVTVVFLISYIDDLLSNKIKFRHEIDVKRPFAGPSDEERLERLGRKLLALPVDEQETLLNRLKEASNAVEVYNPETWENKNPKNNWT
jgi:hypothetical protein